jgi:hypothetical protein
MVQPMTSKDIQSVQQLVITSMPTTIHVTTSLLTHIPKSFDHKPPNGRQPGNSPRGNSLGRDPLKKPPFNPPIGSFG